MQKDGKYKGEHRWMGILTIGEEIVPRLHVDGKGGSWGRQESLWDIPSPQLPPSQPTSNLATVSSPAVSMSIEGSSLPVCPHQSVYFGATVSCQIVVPKLVSIAFSLRPEEALLVLIL